tara:strand:- start:1388 stop:1537 length:150 start_codon:yes stop_codon:yes gene_type:complete
MYHNFCLDFGQVFTRVLMKKEVWNMLFVFQRLASDEMIYSYDETPWHLL